MYTIRQASTRTGVPVALLRAWERRYRIVEPMRTAAGYRLYDEPALQRLRTMRSLVDGGWSPSTAAAAILAGEVPEGAAGRSAREPAELASSSDDGSASADRATIEAFVDAAVALDSDRVEAVLDSMFDGGSFEGIADRRVLPALRALGDAWAAGRVGVAGEHAASHAVLRRLAAAFQAAGRPAVPDGSILVGLPRGSHHELGALAFAVAARRAGLPILYLGPDLPVADWVAAARATRARAAVIGATTEADVEPAVEAAKGLRASDADVILAIGGQRATTAASRLGSDASAVVLPESLAGAVDALASAVREAQPQARHSSS